MRSSWSTAASSHSARRPDACPPTRSSTPAADSWHRPSRMDTSTPSSGDSSASSPRCATTPRPRTSLRPSAPGRGSIPRWSGCAARDSITRSRRRASSTRAGSTPRYPTVRSSCEQRTITPSGSTPRRCAASATAKASRSRTTVRSCSAATDCPRARCASGAPGVPSTTCSRHPPHPWCSAPSTSP